MKKMMFVLCFALLFVGACKEFLKPDRDAFLGEWQCAWTDMSISKGKKMNEIVIDTAKWYCDKTNLVAKVDDNSATFVAVFCENNSITGYRLMLKEDTLIAKYNLNDTTSFTTKFTRL